MDFTEKTVKYKIKNTLYALKFNLLKQKLYENISVEYFSYLKNLKNMKRQTKEKQMVDSNQSPKIK